MQLARCDVEGHHHVAVRTCHPLPHERVRAAVIGSGSSGVYAADRLLKAGFGVDVLEALPTPFGLVRAGAAPDRIAETLARGSKTQTPADSTRLHTRTPGASSGRCLRVRRHWRRGPAGARSTITKLHSALDTDARA